MLAVLVTNTVTQISVQRKLAFTAPTVGNTLAGTG